MTKHMLHIFSIRAAKAMAFLPPKAWLDAVQT